MVKQDNPSERTERLTALLAWIRQLDVPERFRDAVFEWRDDVERRLLRSWRDDYAQENQGRVVAAWNEYAVSRGHPPAVDARYVEEKEFWIVVIDHLERKVGNGLAVDSVIRFIQDIRPYNEKE